MAEEKIRGLCLFDYCSATGFANVASNIMQELNKTGLFDFDIIAINATGDPYDLKRFPFKTYPAVTIKTIAETGSNEPYGRNKFLQMLADNDYDLIFTIQDTFIIQTIMKRLTEIIESKQYKPKTILYYPIDAPPKKDWITEVVAKFDFAIPYTYYAAGETLKVMPELEGKLCKPIYHGTNVEDFHHVDEKTVKDFRHKWFDKGLADDRYLLLNVNRNQPRKDIYRSLQVLKCLRDLGDKDTLLYLHMQAYDAGGAIIEQAQQLGLDIGKDYVLPHPTIFTSNRGVDIETLNMIYNAADCVITTTLGEGWGLSLTEGFATKTPVIAPNHTSITEILDNNRGKLVDAGDSWEAWTNQGNDDNNRMRPEVNVDKFAKAILEVKSGKSLPELDKAYAFAHKYSWKEVCKEWVTIFTEAGRQAQAENLKRQEKVVFKKGVSKKQRRKKKGRR